MATTAAQDVLNRLAATNPTHREAAGTTTTGIESHPRAPFAPTGRRGAGAHPKIDTNPQVFPRTPPQKLPDSCSHFIINRPNESPINTHHHRHRDRSMQPASMHDTIPRPIYTYYFPLYLDGKYRYTQDLLALDACRPRATDPEPAKEMRTIISPLHPDEILHSRSSNDPFIMHLLRSIHFFLAHWEVHLTASHIPGKLNVIADALSRNHMQVFKKEAPMASPNPSHIPMVLQEMLITQRPDWCSQAWKSKLRSLLTMV